MITIKTLLHSLKAERVEGADMCLGLYLNDGWEILNIASNPETSLMYAERIVTLVYKAPDTAAQSPDIKQASYEQGFQDGIDQQILPQPVIDAVNAYWLHDHDGSTFTEMNMLASVISAIRPYMPKEEAQS